MSIRNDMIQKISDVIDDLDALIVKSYDHNDNSALLKYIDDKEYWVKRLEYYQNKQD